MPGIAASPLCSWLVAACTVSSFDRLEGGRGPPTTQPGKCRRPGVHHRRLPVRNLLPNVAGNQRHRPGSSLCGWQSLPSHCKGPYAGHSSAESRRYECSRSFLGSSWALGGNHRSLVDDANRSTCRQFDESEGRRISAPQAASQAGEGSSVRSEDVEKKEKKRRVVVTGLGVVSCLGNDHDVFYDSLLEGKSGVSLIEKFDTSDFSTKIAGEIKEFDSREYMNPKLERRTDFYIRYLLVAGKKALADAGLSTDVITDLPHKEKYGIIIGSGMGGMHVFADAILALRTNVRRMNPFCIPFVTPNMGSALLAMDTGFMGPNYSISTACATGNYCILNAARHIERGDADLMLAGGSDAPILPIGLGGFVACKALSKRNGEPERASRPWDLGRDGFVMGEGAGVLVLEELEHAKSRGAHIYAEFLGGAYSCDGHHMTEPLPDGSGVRHCLEQGLKNCGVGPEDVNYVNAHATSTLAGDMAEYEAITDALGSNMKMNSTKSMTGHLLGAAGAVEAVATVKAITTGWVHPTINVENPDPRVDMNLIPTSKERLDIKVALSNSFGFGGHNSCILFAPYKE